MNETSNNLTIVFSAVNDIRGVLFCSKGNRNRQFCVGGNGLWAGFRLPIPVVRCTVYLHFIEILFAAANDMHK